MTAPTNPQPPGFQFGTPTTSTSAPNLFGSSISNFKPTGFSTPAQNVGPFGTASSTAPPAPGLTFGI